MTSLSELVTLVKRPAGDPSRHCAPSIAYQFQPSSGGGESGVALASVSGSPSGGVRSAKPGARLGPRPVEPAAPVPPPGEGSENGSGSFRAVAQRSERRARTKSGANGRGVFTPLTLLIFA